MERTRRARVLLLSNLRSEVPCPHASAVALGGGMCISVSDGGDTQTPTDNHVFNNTCNAA